LEKQGIFNVVKLTSHYCSHYNEILTIKSDETEAKQTIPATEMTVSVTCEKQSASGR